MSPLAKTLSISASVVILGVATLALTSAANAHPHKKAPKVEAEVDFPEIDFLSDKDIDAHFERHAKTLRDALTKAQKSSRRVRIKELRIHDEVKDKHSHSSEHKDGHKDGHESKRINIIENPDELRDAARTLQNLLADSGILESLADVVIDLAENIEIEDTGDGMRLSFDGKRIGGFSLDEDSNSLSIQSLGSQTTIEKEIFYENGKKKTRIIIETDSDDVDFDVAPKKRSDKSKSTF